MRKRAPDRRAISKTTAVEAGGTRRRKKKTVNRNQAQGSGDHGAQQSAARMEARINRLLHRGAGGPVNRVRIEKTAKRSPH